MRVVGLFFLIGLGAAGCESLGYQPSTLPLQRDEAMQAIGQAHQACLDGKLPTAACEKVDQLVAHAAKRQPLDPSLVLDILKQVLPLAVKGAAAAGLVP